MKSQIGADIVRALLDRLRDKSVDYIYMDADEHGRYLGIVFTDQITECHLTFQEDGLVQLAEGPEEGEELEEVLSFDLTKTEEPFSDDGLGEI